MKIDISKEIIKTNLKDIPINKKYIKIFYKGMKKCNKILCEIETKMNK